MKTLARLSALSVSLATAGILTVGTGLASADSLSFTGPRSHSIIRSGNNRLFSSMQVTNNNRINIENVNHQTAITGDAQVFNNNQGKRHHRCDHHNQFQTTSFHKQLHQLPNKIDHRQGNLNNNGRGQGGSAQTGTASNDNNTQIQADVSNGVPSDQSADLASQLSVLRHQIRPVSVTNISRVTNNNDITINNFNDQLAMSGDATVTGNSRGGSARTGDAMNSNNTDIEVSVMNGAGN